MILRRFMKHVTDQNWFAVGLDVLVVIVGIFLGLQVQAYYTERGERTKELNYLNRLHTEVVQNLTFNQENFNKLFLLLDNFRQTEAYLDEILNVFEGIDTETVLDERHCLAIMSSALYNHQQSYLPTLSELISSGQLSIIENEGIKIALSEYTLSFDALMLQANSLNIMRVELFEKYPAMIKLDRRMRNILQTDQFSHVCDFEAMKENQQFNNDLTATTAKLYYFNLVLANQQGALLNVHEVIDQELNLTHEAISR